MNKYHIRYNTQHGETDQVWRIFENGHEHLVKSFKILVPMYSETTVENGKTKWNVACVGHMNIINGEAVIS